MRDPSRGVIAVDRVPCSQPEPLDSATSTSDKEGGSKNSASWRPCPIVVLAIKARAAMVESYERSLTDCENYQHYLPIKTI